MYAHLYIGYKYLSFSSMKRAMHARTFHVMCTFNALINVHIIYH